MKVLLLVVILGVLHYANATAGECNCAVYLRDGTTNHPVTDSRVYAAPVKNLDSCGAEGKTTCINLCHDAIDKLTDGGKLEHKNKDGKSIAEISCTRLARDLSNGELGSFVKVCDGEWEYTHGTTPKHLCCKDSHPIAC